MTVKHTQSITCLACGQPSDFDFYASINTLFDPALKQRVKNFDIFKFICPHCGSEQFVAYSLLYHQMEDKLMIYCVQDEDDIASVRKLFDEDFSSVVDETGRQRALDTAAYRRRIVVGADSLVEKLRIFDAGLDDRLMEIYKILLYGQMQPQLAEMPGGDDVESLYVDEALDHSLSLVFVADGQGIGAVPFDRAAYDHIASQYSSALEQATADDLLIDQDWAFDFLAQAARGS